METCCSMSWRAAGVCEQPCTAKGQGMVCNGTVIQMTIHLLARNRLHATQVCALDGKARTRRNVSPIVLIQTIECKLNLRNKQANNQTTNKQRMTRSELAQREGGAAVVLGNRRISRAAWDTAKNDGCQESAIPSPTTRMDGKQI